MSENAILKKSNRLISLDAFRGITIAGMILVNNPGSWGAIYPPLGHAKWHGWTPTDFIFPFFLFIVGVAIVYAFANRQTSGASTVSLYLKIIKRTVILFALGLYLSAFKCIPPTALRVFGSLFLISWALYLIIRYTGMITNKDSFLKILKWILTALALLLVLSSLKGVDFTTLRIPGVLQRIAITYCIASVIVLNTGIKGQVWFAVALLVIYWLLMKLVPVSGWGAGMLDMIVDPVTHEAHMGNLAWLIDSNLLAGHTWSGAPAAGFDPEGILSTIPAIATVLFGVLTAHWLKTGKNDYEKVSGLFVFGIIGLVLGEILGIWFPINKNLWSPSYTIFMGGMALLFLGMCYWLIDIRGYKIWSRPFIIFGSNAIAVYTLSGLFARAMIYWWTVPGPDGTPLALKTFLYKSYFEPFLAPLNASLLWAICYVLVWFVFVLILYKKKIFIKI